MPSSTTGEDIDDILAKNGGIGDFEERPDSSTPDVERWLFPRFDGAECIGTCDSTEQEHDGVHDQTEECGESFVADPGNLYLSRSGSGPYDTDVETVAAWLAAPRNVVGATLLLGEPGTGKTALVEAAVTHAGRTLTTVVCTPDHTKDSLFLRFMGEGKGDDGSPFTLGPLPHAAKFGHTLYADEVMLLIDGLKPVLYALADGRRFLPEGNVDGSPLEIHPDFRLILSSNPLVRGASLPEPLASRCASTTLTVETDAEMLRDLRIDDAVVSAWESLGVMNLWRPQIRELRMADYWLNIDVAQAVSAFLPEHCPESQRKQVRDQVVAYLGDGNDGNSIRDDGRLVVK